MPRKHAVSSPRARSLTKLVWLVPLTAMLVYSNTFRSDFTYDDMDIVAKNPAIRSLSNIPGLFTSTYWVGVDSAPDKSLYRPLTMTTYALEYRVHGLRPGWFHEVNVLLHALASLLLFFLVREIFANEALAIIAALLFAVHPIHTEAVANVVGRAEILALVGIILCSWGYFVAMRLQGFRVWCWGLVSVLAYLGGTLSKEVGVTAPAVILMTEVMLPRRRNILRGRRRALALFGGYAASLTLFLLLRSGAVSNRVVHVGFADLPSGARILTALRVLMEYVGLLLAPVRLSADYWRVPITLSPSQLSALAALAVVAAIGYAIAWSWKRYPAIAWGLGLFAITILPVSNIPFAIGVMKAERLLYSPSSGFLVAVGGVLAALLARPARRRAALAMVCAATVALSIMTWERNHVWKDNLSLARATLKRTPDSPSFNVVMGNWYRQQGKNTEAKKYYLKAASLLPSDKATLFNLGNIESDEKNYEAAITYYRRAIGIDPNYASAINNLGSVYHKLGRYTEAAQMFGRFRDLEPNSPHPYLNLMAVYIDARQYDAALTVTQEALRRFPNEADIQANAAILYGLLRRAPAR
ncbi:MAG: tetratricopeptide repeat protein [Candidatus Eisenbacteria bacterium]